MTDKPTDEDVKNVNHASETDDYVPEPDNDPMLADLKELEAEIAAEEAESQGAGTGKPKEKPAGKTEGKPAEGKETEGDGPIMVPKARLDEALSKLDATRAQRDHLSGRVSVLEDMSKGAKPADKTEQDDGKGNQDGAVVDEIDAAIDAAEQKKLELAEKYDEGELSTKDWKAAELAIDKEIRGLTDKREVERLNELKESSKSETDAALNANRVEDWINTKTLEIQQNHPNVAVIEATPEHIKAGIWQQINDQALRNLADQGVNVKDTSPNTRLKIIQEKARLTESYTAESLQAFLPEGFKPPSSQQPNSGTDGQKKPSQAAVNRGQKLDLADSQPPSISDLGAGSGDGELTEADIERMTEDELADMIQKAPARVQRALGLTQL